MQSSSMELEDIESEYLCTLQPSLGSALALRLQELRAASQTGQRRKTAGAPAAVALCSTAVVRTVSSEEECDSEDHALDSTALYPPHVSVSGFFKASARQAAEFCKEVSHHTESAVAGSLGVELRRVVSTESGHVLIDVHAPGVASFAKSLAAKATALGVSLRPKAMRHLSVASGRSPAEQSRIAGLYDGATPTGLCQLDLVVARLRRRSDLQRLRCHGEAHCFEELLRVALPFSDGSSSQPAVPAAVPAVSITIANPVNVAHLSVSTPDRKRPVSSSASSVPAAQRAVSIAATCSGNHEVSAASKHNSGAQDASTRQTPPKCLKVTVQAQSAVQQAKMVDAAVSGLTTCADGLEPLLSQKVWAVAVRSS